jgi:hypothetical protein
VEGSGVAWLAGVGTGSNSIWLALFFWGLAVGRQLRTQPNTSVAVSVGFGFGGVLGGWCGAKHVYSEGHTYTCVAAVLCVGLGCCWLAACICLAVCQGEEAKCGRATPHSVCADRAPAKAGGCAVCVCQRPTQCSRFVSVTYRATPGGHV